MKLNDGDIFTWVYSDVEVDPAKQYGEYHCKSQIAIAKDGVLYDTFWGDFNRPIPIDKIVLKFQGNPKYLTVIKSYDIPYYDPADIVDMRHSNSSSQPIYLKHGATKSPSHIKTRLDDMMRSTTRDLETAMRRIKSIGDMQTALDDGKYDEIYL